MAYQHTGPTKGTLAILVGGGPAPAINAVISAATIEAAVRGYQVLGIMDGYKWLSEKDTSQVRPLTINDVSRIHFTGGSVLRTSRANPTKSETSMTNVVHTLAALGVTHLITIGGDDTAYAASQIAERLSGQIRVAHVPKTIDNDLPLPGNEPTFGYQTARHVGVELISNLMEDSRTTSRWYFVVLMGRHAGHLALGTGKAAGATVTIIAEEFGSGKVTVREVCDILECAILKRRVMGRNDGIAVLAEGLAEHFHEEDLRTIGGVEYDSYGHVRLGEVELGKLLKNEVIRRFKDRGDPITVVDKNIGYELRCADPIPFDCEYARDLGYGAIKHLLSAAEDPRLLQGCMICVVAGKLSPIPLNEILDPETHRIKVRYVDIATESYEVAREYMIRLEDSDFDDQEWLSHIAAEAKLTADEFRNRYSYLLQRHMPVSW